MGFFEDVIQGLNEVIEIENGNIQLIRKENMPADTFYVEEIKDLDEKTPD